MVSISVVMPTFNTTAAVLHEAVESILSQTFRDFEFIIIDDGSTDDSYDYLRGLHDERIKLIRNSYNQGITKSLNIGLSRSKGKYIARMDSDDIAMPFRLEKQFAFMECHPDVIACGSNVEVFGGESFTTHNSITDMEVYRIRMVFSNPGPYHPTAFLRRDLLLRYHIKYDEALIHSQDYGLWVELSRHGKVCILEEALIKYRIHPHQVTKTRRKVQIQCDQITQERLLKELLGNVTGEELAFHYLYSTGYYKDVTINTEILDWYKRLVKANDQVGVYDKKKFRDYVYNTVLKRIIYQSFDQSTTVFTKIVTLFRYLPFPIAMSTVKEIVKRKMMDRIRDRVSVKMDQ